MLFKGGKPYKGEEMPLALASQNPRDAVGEIPCCI